MIPYFMISNNIECPTLLKSNPLHVTINATVKKYTDLFLASTYT